MAINVRLVNKFLRGVFSLVCRVDRAGLDKIPRTGPYIMVGNHINFLEAPVLIPHLDNPNVIGIAKRESWDNPLFRFLFNLWHVIPIDRGMVDRNAFQMAFEALDEGKILAVFPEGTRSGDGKLLKAKPGVVALAVRSKVPLLPVAFYGYENFWQNLKQFRRTEFKVAVGTPFTIDTQGAGLSREMREQLTDEIMYKVAELLPDEYHGYYQNPDEVNFQFVNVLAEM